MKKAIYSTFFAALFPLCLAAQAFPDGWTGTYQGEMKITSGQRKNAVSVTLEIGEKIRDSSWTYKMTYQGPNGETVKDYQIVRKTDSEYVMDEGGIKIAMRYVDNTFFDFYQVDSVFYTSVLRKTGKNAISFDIYGGPMGEKDKITTNEGDFFVHSYIPTFTQSVVLKRKKMK